jgi:hypothetical protein
VHIPCPNSSNGKINDEGCDRLDRRKYKSLNFILNLVGKMHMEIKVIIGN